MADAAYPGDKLDLPALLQVSYRGDVIRRQLRRQRLADAPDDADRPRPQERRRLGAADDGKAARLVQVRGHLGQELVVAEADRDRDADFLLDAARSEEHTSELQSLMRTSYAVFCLKKKNTTKDTNITRQYYK